ncbi:hypothetical protein B1987_02085 [Mycobacterium kansasii]|uniref:Uncharacterized protein n=1 Tax=Mycobacterium attenuatum TaxID=2341086 RepID=A0A498Q3A5_9MYCO|nr:hypothetical protein [Mycobacterium attenuatum]ORB82829.1 hypothetical protein B1987_02085 [Mycobacterium kansasii]VBA39817.1 hypothetical protein LAUMK136_03188 [Mycobacterium attenuatum]VBA54630.1 hypothetical protein LAUMK191_03160 [Mycobacterium attenuatum]VBA58923.1 hypothetical protein LAUMK41_03226 [Mycobacterium attenuatum]
MSLTANFARQLSFELNRLSNGAPGYSLNEAGRGCAGESAGQGDLDCLFFSDGPGVGSARLPELVDIVAARRRHGVAALELRPG